jgi:hypothetical protein
MRIWRRDMRPMKKQCVPSQTPGNTYLHKMLHSRVPSANERAPASNSEPIYFSYIGDPLNQEWN